MESTMNVPGYEGLADVLLAAYNQAARGKGHERHVGDRPLHFSDQPMQSICRMLGDSKGMAYQAIKKIEEAGRMEGAQRRKELLGAIVYIAGMIVFDDDKAEPETGQQTDPGLAYVEATIRDLDKYAGHPLAAPAGRSDERCVQCLQPVPECSCGYTKPGDPHDPYSRR